MKSYSETHKVFTPLMVEYLHHAENIVKLLPDKIEGNLVRCHEVARVVQRALKRYVSFKNLTTAVLDGRCGPMPHSFILVTEIVYTDAHQHKAILDPYCVGRLPQVQLVSLMPPHLELYKPGPLMSDDINHRHIDIMADVLRPDGYGFSRE